MTFTTILLLFLAGLGSGAINAVAGGGTFITFGVLTLAGVPPVSANATASVIQFPGYVTSALAYLKDIRSFWRTCVLLALCSGVGAVGGALLLLSLDDTSFASLVPWLLFAATALFAAGPWLKPKGDGQGERSRDMKGALIQFLTGFYGGFFGAGMGVMMLATLGLTERGDYHRLNAIKNLLSIVIAVVAMAIFVTGGLVSWQHAAVCIPAVAIGGFSGVWLARRVSTRVLRSLVIITGILLGLYYLGR